MSHKNKPTTMGSRGNDKKERVIPHTELRAAPLDLGFLLPQPPSQPQGPALRHPAQSRLSTAIPTFFLCPFRYPALGRGPFPGQARNKHTYPCPSTHLWVSMGTGPSDTGRCRRWASRHPSICPFNQPVTNLHRLRLKFRGHHPQSSQPGDAQTQTQVRLVPADKGGVSPGEAGQRGHCAVGLGTQTA